MDQNTAQIGRLAMREEGQWWNAYFAKNDTMEGATHLGSILMSAIENNKEARKAFLSLMRSVIEHKIEELTGETPSWSGVIPAPEHEKSGKA